MNDLANVDLVSLQNRMQQEGTLFGHCLYVCCGDQPCLEEMIPYFRLRFQVTPQEGQFPLR